MDIVLRNVAAVCKAVWRFVKSGNYYQFFFYLIDRLGGRLMPAETN